MSLKSLYSSFIFDFRYSIFSSHILLCMQTFYTFACRTPAVMHKLVLCNTYAGIICSSVYTEIGPTKTIQKACLISAQPLRFIVFALQLFIVLGCIVCCVINLEDICVWFSARCLVQVLQQQSIFRRFRQQYPESVAQKLPTDLISQRLTQRPNKISRKLID